MINEFTTKILPIKLFIAQTEKGFSCGIIDEQLYNTNDYYVSLTLARGMLRLVLKNPDMVFDEGVLSMGEEMESEDNLDLQSHIYKMEGHLKLNSKNLESALESFMQSFRLMLTY